MARRGRDDWERAVFRHKKLNGNVAVLLLYLAKHMKSDLTVSVPRSQIAEDLNVYPSRVTERIRAAHDAGLLTTVAHGYQGSTAVYKAIFPVVGVQTGGQHERGTATRTPNGADRGTGGGPTISETSPSEGRESPEAGVSRAERARTEKEDKDKKHAGTAQAGRETRSWTAQAGRETARQLLLTAIQNAAVKGLNGEAGDELFALLNAQFGDEVEGYAANYWSVPSKASNRYEAGVWLNKLVNSARQNGLLPASVNEQEPRRGARSVPL